MTTPLDHLLAALVALGLPVRAYLMFRSVQGAAQPMPPGRRRALYTQAMVVQWTLVACLLALWASSHRPWEGLGLVWRPLGGFWGVLGGLLLIAPFLWRQFRSLDAESALRARRQFERIEPILPHTRAERSHFFALAATAGICEELLFRGFLIWYLAHWTGLIQAIVLTSVAFGLGHAYQGRAGMWKTGLVGAFMGMVYLLSGSIWLPMLIHAGLDAYSGAVIQRVYEMSERPPAAAPGPVAA